MTRRTLIICVGMALWAAVATGDEPTRSSPTSQPARGASAPSAVRAPTGEGHQAGAAASPGSREAARALDRTAAAKAAAAPGEAAAGLARRDRDGDGFPEVRDRARVVKRERRGTHRRTVAGTGSAGGVRGGGGSAVGRGFVDTNRNGVWDRYEGGKGRSALSSGPSGAAAARSVTSVRGR